MDGDADALKRTVMKIAYYSSIFLILCSAKIHAEVFLQVTESPNGYYKVIGHFLTKSSKQSIWKVLTDYDHIGNFVPDIRKSRLIAKSIDSLTIEQESVQNFIFFKKLFYVSLKVRETPYAKIEFTDTAKQAFHYYEGSWAIKETSDYSEIQYVLDVRPVFQAPDFIQKRLMRKTIKMLLENLKDEIDRRAAQGNSFKQ